MSTRSLVASQVLHPHGGRLLEQCVRSIEDLRAAAGSNAKVAQLKGNQDLIVAINEVMKDLDEQRDRILSTVENSRAVYEKINLLIEASANLHAFFEKLNNKTTLIFAKTKLRKDMRTLSIILKGQCTDLMSAVSLELLGTGAPAAEAKVVTRPKEPEQDVQVKYNSAIHSYYGINCPKNYTVAFGSFMYSAQRNHIPSMLMVAEMYRRGHGVNQDTQICRHWLERTIALGSPAAKYHLGVLIICKYPIEVKCNPSIIEEFSILPDAEQFREVLEALATKLRSSLVDAFNRANADLEHDEGAAVLEQITTDGDNGARPEDLRSALTLLLSAASDDYAEAMTEIGQIFEVLGQYPEAAESYKSAAAKDCLRAQNALANLYFTGKGVPCKLETAQEMFMKAANGGNCSALNNVALCYERGYGTEVDIEAAYDTYLKGAVMGSPQAMFSVGYLAIKRALAETSSGELLKSIVHKTGIQKPRVEETLDSAKSTAEAITILRRISTFRRVSPTKNIDFNSDREALLRNGIRWMRRASESSVGEAGYQLGLLYERGLGLPFDNNAAYEQFLWAAERGDFRGSLQAARMLYDDARSTERQANGDVDQLKLCQQMYVGAGILYKHAAESGVAEAMNALGIMLEDGTASPSGVPNPAEAARWFLAAAGIGSVEAAGNLALLLAAKGGGFDFPDTGIVLPSGERASPMELEAWLDGLAQRASGDAKAQWLRDAVSRLSGKSITRELQSRYTTLGNLSKQNGVTFAAYPTSPGRGSRHSSEPTFNALPSFSKRQVNQSHATSLVGDNNHPVAQLRSSDIDVKSVGDLHTASESENNVSTANTNTTTSTAASKNTTTPAKPHKPRKSGSSSQLIDGSQLGSQRDD